MDGKTVDQIYVDNLYAEITKLTRRAVEAETLLEYERSQRQAEAPQVNIPDLPEDAEEPETTEEPEEA